MQKTKKVKETRELEVNVCLVCDLCGAESNQPDGWSSSSYSSFKGKFTLLDIDSYPGDYQSSGYVVDLCPACGKKVMDKLIEMGVDREKCKHDSNY